MSVFRRRPADQGPTEVAEPATVPVMRDPDLAVPPFRPAPGQASKDTAMSLPPKPTAPQGAPGVTMPPRPAAAAAARPAISAAERRTLVVGKGISLQGTVTDAERLVVDGTVESQMIQATELQITHSGVFKGEVQVEDAEIAGVFDGTITARGSLIIRATGRVLGVARTRRLSVEDGGQLSGRMEMLTEAQASAPPGAPAAAQPSQAPQYASPDLASQRS
jgi:cytoskeletal protein CcmA (bactofilin family)